MATSADAETALAALLWAALSPIASKVKVIRGWPSPSALDNEIKAGNVIISVYRLDVSRNTTRYLGTPSAAAIPPPTLGATTAGSSATFTGTADAGQIAGIVANGIAYPVRTVVGDTPSTIAAKIAEQMSGPVIVSGSTITAAGLSDARTAADATAYQEVGRQENTFQADAWCPTPDLRDQVEALVLPAVAAATFLPMPDGSTARARLGAVMASDQASPLTIYRLMLRVTAEVTLNTAEQAAIMLWPSLMVGQYTPAMSSAPAPMPSSMTALTSSGSGTTITYPQPTPLLTWTITHNMHRYPSVVVIDTALDQIEPAIQYLSLDVVQITFSAPTAGTAYLS